jgi:hypothetical protein
MWGAVLNLELLQLIGCMVTKDFKDHFVGKHGET